MAWTAKQLLDIVLKLAPAELQQFADELPFALPLEVLVILGEAVYGEIEAQTEKEQMQEAVKAADAVADLAEAEALKARGL